jgi:hypothetical protein
VNANSSGSGNPARAFRSRSRRIAFRAWAAILVAVFDVAFFGVPSLVLAWFQEVEGVAGPVTDLGYGVLVGIILTTGLLVQLRGPERRIAGVQQAFLVIPALVIGSAIASDSQNLVPALILLPAIGILLALHPARAEFFRRGAALSRTLLAITFIAAVPLVAYALDMGAQARDLAGPPHHAQRLSTMAAMALAIVLTGLLAALRTRGWRIPAWSAGVAADRVRARVGGLPGSCRRRGPWMGRRGHRGRCPVHCRGRMGDQEGDGHAQTVVGVLLERSWSRTSSGAKPSSTRTRTSDPSRSRAISTFDVSAINPKVSRFADVRQIWTDPRTENSDQPRHMMPYARARRCRFPASLGLPSSLPPWGLAVPGSNPGAPTEKALIAGPFPYRVSRAYEHARTVVVRDGETSVRMLCACRAQLDEHPSTPHGVNGVTTSA